MIWIWKRLEHVVILTTIVLSTARSLKNGDVVIHTEKQLLAAENTTAYRLPEIVVPETYYIRLTPFITTDNFTFDGVIRIIANVTKKTSNIVLHTEKLKIHKVTIVSVNKKTGLSKLPIKNVTEQMRYQFLNIEMDQPIDANTNITIAISYTGTINKEMKGLFKNSYTTINNKTRWILSTQMEATGARNVFPCFDEPALRAVFQISVVVPQNYTAISNMPVRSITKGHIYEFEMSPSMPTYLVALVVTDFKNLTINDVNRTYRVWAQSELVHQLPYSLAVIPKALSFFEKRLGEPYPLPKVDMVALPDFTAEAMENWGLQIYSEMLMLNEPTTTPLLLKRYVRNLVTHENAHQWFGNLVTPKWWDYLWLKEGFAQYFEYHAHGDEISSWNLESEFVVDIMHQAFTVDAEEDIHPITNRVYSPSEIAAMFDLISYNKAGCIIRMLEKVLGPKIFYGALARYIKKNKYSTGTPELLIEAFEDEIKANDYILHASMAEVINTWTIQPGFPVVNVQTSGDTVAIRQKRFFLHPPRNHTFNTAWCVPINWVTQSKPDFSNNKTLIWIRDNFTSISIENASKEWVIFNIQQTGFYRVNYDSQMWQRIINALKSNDYKLIHEINRASLIDDLFNLGRIGEVDYEIVFNATQYLKKETNYIPWRAAFSGLSYLKTRLVGHAEIYNRLKVYVISLLEPIYRRLGFDEKNDESNFDTLLRKNMLEWLCSLDYQECISRAWNTFNNLQQKKISVISPNQQGFIYCTVIKHGSMKEITYLWQKFKKSIYSSERHTILTALTCSRNSSQIEKILIDVLTLKHKIKQEQVSEMIKSIAKNYEIGLPTILSYIKHYFDDFIENIDDENDVKNYIKFISTQLSTKDQVNQLDAILKNNQEKLSNISKSLQFLLENTIYELNRLRNYSPKILNWLTNNIEMHI
ncbi:aminopeptidase N-like [Phymastichus coffea]|uniref:aminopeptidase N-like n=1 Tax=Phymastichus coffea TaxID=108790 RepID=UPI00273ABD9C|nr:aminopeptidase N-like [Phymastichus coffea]